jgi:hypothetical protein
LPSSLTIAEVSAGLTLREELSNANSFDHISQHCSPLRDGKKALARRSFPERIGDTVAYMPENRGSSFSGSAQESVKVLILRGLGHDDEFGPESGEPLSFQQQIT